MRLTGSLNHPATASPQPSGEVGEAESRVLAAVRPLRPLRHGAVRVTAHIAVSGGRPAQSGVRGQHELLRAGDVGPAVAVRHHLVSAGQDTGEVPPHEAAATGRALELTLRPGGELPLVAGGGGAGLGLAQHCRAGPASGRGRHHDVPQPGEVPAQPSLAALTLGRVPD